MSINSTASEEGGSLRFPATWRTWAPTPSGRTPTITARSSSPIWSLSTGRAEPVTVAISAPSAGSQVAKQPSLYWLATHRHGRHLNQIGNPHHLGEEAALAELRSGRDHGQRGREPAPLRQRDRLVHHFVIGDLLRAQRR